MRASVLSGIAAIALLTPCAGGAVVIGDKDWRQLTETVNFTWNEINSVCGSGLCSGGTDALATLNGWHWAAYDEVSDLLLGLAGGQWSFCNALDCFFIGQNAGIDWAFAHFDPTYSNPSYDEVAGFARTYLFQAGLANSDTDDLAYIFDWPTNEDERSTGLGVWLYRDVPEPGTLALLCLGLAGLTLSRRRIPYSARQAHQEAPTPSRAFSQLRPGNPRRR